MDKFEKVLQEVEARFTEALAARVTPRLVFNRIAAPALAGAVPDSNWSQPLSLLSRSAIALRKSLADPFFPRQFVGLTCSEADFRKLCNPFEDLIVASPDVSRAREELLVLANISNSSAQLKIKCLLVWNLIRELPDTKNP